MLALTASVTGGLQSGTCLLTQEPTARQTDCKRNSATANTSVKFNLFSTTAINCRLTCRRSSAEPPNDSVERSARRRLRAQAWVNGPCGGDLESGVFTDCHFFWLDLVYEDLLSVKRLVRRALQVLNAIILDIWSDNGPADF